MGVVVWGMGDMNQELKVLLNVHKSIENLTSYPLG